MPEDLDLPLAIASWRDGLLHQCHELADQIAVTEVDVGFSTMTSTSRGPYNRDAVDRAEATALREKLDDLWVRLHHAATKHVAFDLDLLADRYPVDEILIDNETVEAITLLSVFVDHRHGKVLPWLTGHTTGPEAVLAMVGVLNLRHDLPFTVEALPSLPPPEQVRALAALTNHMGRDRLTAAAQRRGSEYAEGVAALNSLALAPPHVLDRSYIAE